MKRALTLFGFGLVAVSAALGQLVVGSDGTGTQTIWLIDLSGANPNRALVTDTTAVAKPWGMAADEETQTLYWNGGGTLFKAAYTPSGTLAPITVGTMTVGGSNMNVTGMAYDTADNKLVGYRSVTAPGFYEIDVNTAVCTLVVATPASSDFGGLDYDAVGDVYYGLNDGTGLSGRGLYRITKPLATATYTLVAAYPAGDTDIDGLSVGPDRAFWVNDVGTQPIYVTDLAGTSLPNLTNPLVTGTFAAGAYAPGLLAPATGSDVRITKTDSPDPVVPPGGNITYTINVTNNGPDDATGVAVQDTLPGNVTFVSVTPPGMHNAGEITADIGPLANGGSVSFDVVVQTQGAGTVSNTATVTSSSQDDNQSNNSATANTTVRDFQADVGVAITDPTDCSVPIGGTADYSIAVTNAGPETAVAAEIVITLPSNATFNNSNPPGVPVGNLLTLALGDIGPGGNSPVTLQLSPTSGTSLDVSASVSSTTDDPNGGNDTDAESMLLQNAAPGAAAIKGVLSTIVTSPTSDVPGLPGVKFNSTGGLDRPFRSPSGQRWIMTADTDAATTQDQVLLTGNGTSFAVAAQEGVTPTPDQGDLAGLLDTVQGINDAGQYVFSTNTNGATTNDEVVVKWDGTQFVTVAREGNAVAPIAGALYAITSGSATIASDGMVSFYTTLAGATATTDSALLADDGATLVAQEGVTIPGNQNAGAMFTWDEFDSGSTDGLGFFTNADASRYITSGDTSNADTNTDKVAVVDGNVVIQENVIIAGSGFPSGTDMISPINQVNMESNGDWLAYGDNNDDQDWVLRNGAVIAVTDAPIFTGATELYDDAPYAQTFFFALGNASGDYVVGGTTNAADGGANAVLVLNGATVIARENDPIDLDNDGMFDDAVYLSVFRDDFAYMTETEMWVVVRLRDEAEALCAAGDNDIGQALVRIPLGGDEACPNPGCDSGGVDVDFDDNCIVDLSDLAFLLGGFGCTSNCAADTDGNDMVDLSDLANLLGRFGNDCN